MHHIIRMLLYENGELSLTRVIAASGWIAFLVVSFYLAYFNINWDLYYPFATVTGGGGPVTQLTNKFINSKLNTPRGSYGPGPTSGTVHTDGK
nr:MAG TPA: hypothetical protein [Bacteriophage sp.]